MAEKKGSCSYNDTGFEAPHGDSSAKPMQEGLKNKVPEGRNDPPCAKREQAKMAKGMARPNKGQQSGVSF